MGFTSQVITKANPSAFPVLDKAYVITYNFHERYRMTTLTVTEARARLYKLLDQVAASHKPILITGKRANAVLISEEDWHAIEETMYLLGVPEMRDSIIEGLKTPVEDCADEVEW
jgi:prevent-host-death family protein